MDGKSGGISFLGLLTVAFIVLKLMGIIHWSWVWVLAPFWLPLAIIIVIVVIYSIVIDRKSVGGKKNGL